MSEKIDWSKAPADATHYSEKYGAFFRESTHKDLWIEIESGCTVEHPGSFIARPTTPSWSGEGLPPVGIDCEYMKRGGADWFHCTVIAEHDGGVVVAVHEDDLSYTYWNDTGHFRPIRTTEQIAADEREAAIKEMTADYADHSAALRGWAIYVYDELGYRKP